MRRDRFTLTVNSSPTVTLDLLADKLTLPAPYTMFVMNIIVINMAMPIVFFMVFLLFYFFGLHGIRFLRCLAFSLHILFCVCGLHDMQPLHLSFVCFSLLFILLLFYEFGF